jgi:anti-sigma factor RsiW
MNHSHENERLDATIDSLLASNPLPPSEKFTTRVMAAVEEEAANPGAPNPAHRTGRKLASFALPLAAALALAALLWPSLQTPPVSSILSFEETQEIIELEESLRALAPLQEADDFSTSGLLATLETATYAL